MKKRYTLEQKRWDSPTEHAMPEHTRVPASFTIGNVTIAPATVLAPMAGVTDTVFRRFIKNASQFTASTESSTNVESITSNQQSGCGLIMTEFTSADGLSRMRETKRKRYLTYYDDEHPISAQLFRSNPETPAVKDAVSSPVIGNGDIRTPEHAAATVDATHCDAVMIGRTAPANPWTFRQIAQYTAPKEATGTGRYDHPTNDDRYRMIRTYFQMLVDEIAIEEAAEAARAAAITQAGKVPRQQRNRHCFRTMKQFASCFTNYTPGSSAPP